MVASLVKEYRRQVGTCRAFEFIPAMEVPETCEIEHVVTGVIKGDAYRVRTARGWVQIFPGDYIIEGDGEWYPCRPGEFQAKYVQTTAPAWGLFKPISEIVQRFNRENGITNPAVMWNVVYLALAMSGEAGELANAVKKIVRDGYSEARMANVEEELVDVVIYTSMMIEALNMNFDDAFYMKQDELQQRYKEFQKRGFNIHENMMKDVGIE